MAANREGSTISEATRSILINSVSVTNIGVLITKQLSRADYKNVNDVLASLGGAWNKKTKTHVFADRTAEQIREDLDTVVLTGRIMRDADFGWFPTPPQIAEQLVSMLGIDARKDVSILEPSAGMGALVKAIVCVTHRARVTCVEVHEQRAAAVSRCIEESIAAETIAAGSECVRADFLETSPQQLGMFDYVVMNPPFAPNRADIAHVRHALQFVKPGGTLVSVMAGGITFREDSRSETFRLMVNVMRGEIEKLPSGSFKTSGTAVETVVVRITKHEIEQIG